MQNNIQGTSKGKKLTQKQMGETALLLSQPYLPITEFKKL